MGADIRWHLAGVQQLAQQKVLVAPVKEEMPFAMGARPAVCSTGDVCLALDYLEDPLAHGIVQQVSRASALTQRSSSISESRAVYSGCCRAGCCGSDEYLVTYMQYIHST